MTEPKPHIEADEVRILRAQPGDVIVLRFKHRITQDMASRIAAQWEPIIPDGVKVAIFSKDTEIEVMRA